MKLSPLFQQGMVLQRNKPNLFWGYGTAGRLYTGRFAGIEFSFRADDGGYFEVTLPFAPCGGPYELVVCGKEPLVIKDIMVGDVFLLGGQSNMELPLARTLDLFREELKDLDHRDIRIFEVPKEYSFQGFREELEGGIWKAAVGHEALSISAAGYFMALALNGEYGIPVGLIQTAVGGTPVEAWCARESLKRLGVSLEVLGHCGEREIEDVLKAYAQTEAAWHHEAAGGFASPQNETGTIEIPGLWEGTHLGGFTGGMILERTITILEGRESEPAYLILGAMTDSDRVFVNGKQVGSTGYEYPPRRYRVEPGILKAGENRIRIELCVYRGQGGFMPDKVYGLEGKDYVIDLTGSWDYTLGKRLPALPKPVFFQYKPTGLYQGMIYPLRRYAVCGAVFYQGESNTDQPFGYEKKMEAMISDWRRIRKDGKLPFIYVQLSGFSYGRRDWGGKNWAVLRECQSMVQRVPETAMVVSYDAGEYNDLHPQDKKTVGGRLALAVKSLIYQENAEYRGPEFQAMEETKNGIRLMFSHTGGQLYALQRGVKSGDTKDPDKEQAGGFSYLWENGEEADACARIDGETVWLEAAKHRDFKWICYGWADHPQTANLYSRAGLPAVPFRVERSME